MPILPKESAEFPENLLEEVAAADTARRWWLIYTKARQEKALARDLCARETPFYLPLIQKSVARQGRRRDSFNPLFGSYLFLFGNERERLASLATNRVSRVLEVPDQGRLLFDLQQLRRLIASGAAVALEPRLEVGRRVRIEQGSLAGMQGTIISRRGVQRLLIAVDFLQQGASIEIADHLVEPVD